MVDQHNRMDGDYNHRSCQKSTVSRGVEETTLVFEGGYPNSSEQRKSSLSFA